MRLTFHKVAGWLLVALGVLMTAGDFAASDHTFRDFSTALKNGLVAVVFGLFNLAVDRIDQLKRENALLRARAAKDETESPDVRRVGDRQAMPRK